MKLATMCYIKKDNKTLMLHRIKKENDIHEGKWVGLGGKMEKGETPEECIIREVKEESGLTIQKPILKGFITFPGFKNDEDWYTFVYIAEKFEGKLIECNEGVLRWIEDSEVLNLNMWEGDRLFLEWIESGRMFSGKLTYKNGVLVEQNVIYHS